MIPRHVKINILSYFFEKAKYVCFICFVKKYRARVNTNNILIQQVASYMEVVELKMLTGVFVQMLTEIKTPYVQITNDEEQL